MNKERVVIMGKLLDFIFGKAPKIFDPDGTVRHNFPKEKWDAWQARYLQGEEYNWRNHAGVKAKELNAKKDSKH
jgi:hypothetical protein